MSDQFFKKRKGRRQNRKKAIKEMAPFRYLIVCEGERTEPNYFRGIGDRINDKFGHKIEVDGIKANRFEIEGSGKNTESLVRSATDKKRSAEIPYGHVWCVFDKDSFSDEKFDNAINQAEKNDLKVAWSNEAIELWFLLHFEYLNADIHRDQYIKKLNKYFSEKGLNNGGYEKNLVDIYELLSENGDIYKAIKYARKLEEIFKKDSPSKSKLSTTVYLLVEELLGYLESK